MIAITLGFTGNGRNAAPTVLYSGNDATAAEAAFMNPPPGTGRTVLIKNPSGRNRYHAKPEPAPSDPSAPSDTSDKPAPRGKK